MLKNLFKLMVVSITLFYFNENIYAYEYIDSNNKGNVNNMINQIYDAKEQYEDLAGEYVESIKYRASTSTGYWWPIGSSEVEDIGGKPYAKGDPVASVVTSEFGSQENFRDNAHGAIDISVNGAGANEINIIAARSGEVVYPTKSSETEFNDNGYYGNPDGGGYGNYVKIKHSDGTYTIYAHLAKSSITVMSGDVVDRGQVIGKMGHSGSSTGVHLHFEMRDANNNKIDPMQYVSLEHPRSFSASSGSFSLEATTLSKAEFKAKMQDYYNRTNDENFNKNFLSKVDEIYDASLKYNVNPELVVVTAKAESGFVPCGYTNNYWGIGIANGQGCNAGPTFNTMSQGIEAYSKILFEYTEQGSFANSLMNRYDERESAGCDVSGHGLPGTLEGMQSVYSWIGNYRYNPGDPGLGGCYYLNIIYGENYCSTVPTCNGQNCSNEAATTVCEQNDYTAWQVKKKVEFRYDIFGL